MKSKKRLVSLLLTLIMVLTAMPMNGIASMAVSASDFTEPTIFADSKYSAANSTISVDIAIVNNPGIAGATLTVAYDPLLTLTAAANGEAFSSLTFTKPGSFSNPSRFLWDSESGETKKDGTILTLTFDVSESAPAEANLNIEISSNLGDFYDEDMETVNLQLVNGTITVIDYLPGDVNGDDVVNGKDVTMVRRHIVGGYDQIINEAAADVNEDGTINGKDVTAIRRYIVGGYNIVLKPAKPYCEHQMYAEMYKAATCTEDGNIAYWYCMLCNKYFKDEDGTEEVSFGNTIIPAKGHTVVIDPAIPATETSNGLTEGSHCSDCNEVIIKQDIIPMINPQTANIIYKLVNNDGYLASQTIDNPNPITYVIGKGLTLSNDLSVPGYTFEGWFDGFGSNATQIKNISINETEDITLYAHWSLDSYSIQYESDLIPVDSDVYTVNQSKTLPTPKLSGYTFIGWSDEDGNIIRRIPAGTTDHKIYTANWLSDRNKAISYNNVDSPLVLEEDNKILFTYEIGEIQNVPVSVIKNFGKIVEGGVSTEYTVQHSKTIDSTEIKNYERTVASATTENYGITLSNGWTDSMTVNEEVCQQNGWSQEEAKQYAVNESDNWYVSSGSSGSKTTNTYSSNEKTSLKTSTSHSEKLVDHVREATRDATSTDNEYQNYNFEENVNASGGIGPVKIEGGLTASQAFGSNSTDTGENFSKDFLNTKTFTSEDKYKEKGSRSVTGSNSTSSASWNSESGKGGSQSVTDTTSTAKAITEALSEKTGYGKTYINTGSEQTTQGLSSTALNSDRYSTGSTYSIVDQEIITEKVSTQDTREGYHRVVWATTMHVFLIVGYDIATSSYFTSTVSIQDDDIQRFEDYSYNSPSYDDNETSLITFEIPTDIKEYVRDKTAGSEGLQYSRDGKVTGYSGTDDYVIIPEYKVINGTVIKVTSIDQNAFKGKTTVEGGNTFKAVELSEFITEIPDSAFEGCTALEFIDLKNVDNIGSKAFAGCTSLKAIKLSDKVTSLGQQAFEGIDAVMVYAANKKMVEAVADSGAKAIVIVVSDGCNDLTNCTISIPEGTEFFEFYGNVSEPRDFNDVYIISDADETAIINANFISSKKTPITISSADVIWAESDISAPSFDMILTADTTNMSIYGESSFISSNEKSMLTKKLNIDLIDEELYSKLHVSGDVYVCDKVSDITDNSYLDLVDGSIVAISAAEFEKYVNGFYTVSFNANGGNLSGGSKEVYYGQQYGDLPVPTKSNYAFDGWYTALNGGDKITNSSTVLLTSDQTLYAHWVANKFNIIYNANGGTVSVASKTISFGDSYGTLPTPTRVGFTFAGWYTAASGGSQVSASTKPTSATNVTIYAHWTCNSYTASWSTGTGYSITVKRTSSPNGGASTGTISSGAKVYYGDVLNITYTASTGYSISSKGSTSITVSGNVSSSNIYATATANSYTYNVVYKSSNGTALGSTTVTKTFGTTNTISAPAKTGYTTPSSQSVKWDSTSKTITFSYTPISQSATQTIATGTWWTSSSGSSKITYKVEAQWRNRTATSIEIRVHWTNTITNSYNSGYYGYKQEFEWWGWHTIAAASAFSSPGGTRTSSCYSDWHTYTISATDTSRNIGSEWKDNNGKSGNWSGTVKIPAY